MQIAPATKSYINKRIIWGIGIFFITMMVAILGYGFSQMEWTSNGKDNLSFSDQLSKLDASKFFNNDLINGFMMINVILGLLLLDHYLRNKRKSFHKEA
jgi:magnesium-transporting ATPase (P-type)